MSDQQHRGRSGNPNPEKSKSRKNSPERGEGRSQSVSTTTTIKTQNGHGRGKSKEGKGKEHNHKQMSTEEMEKEVERRKKQSAEQSEMQKQKNTEVKQIVEHELNMVLQDPSKRDCNSEYQETKTQWLREIDSQKQEQWFKNISEARQKKQLAYMMKEMNRALNAILSNHHVLGTKPSAKAVEKQVNEMHKNAKLQALPAPHAAHAHVHPSLPTPHGAHAHVHPGHTSVDELPQDAQMSYNNALWGAATHTRAGDSLRYL
jgi:hypothetical protein